MSTGIYYLGRGDLKYKKYMCVMEKYRQILKINKIIHWGKHTRSSRAASSCADASQRASLKKQQPREKRTPRCVVGVGVGVGDRDLLCLLNGSVRGRRTYGRPLLSSQHWIAALPSRFRPMRSSSQNKNIRSSGVCV